MIPEQVGRYKISELLGKGAMGEVYRAHDPDLSRDVAIKFVSLPRLEHDDIHWQRFRREVQAAAQLKHAHIITIYDVGFGNQTTSVKSTSGSINFAKLRQLLVSHFSISELHNLCFDLGVNYDSLPGDNLDDEARELISYFERHGRTAELCELCRQQRPNIPWQDITPPPPLGSSPPYVVMELLTGGTLADKLEAESLSWQESLKLFIPLCQALAHAHQAGVVHRDIKPANIMFAGDEANTLKLVDFGLARWDGSDHVSQVGNFMGTPAYVSPEQAQGHLVDDRTDIYALGVILFRMVTGRLPFSADTPMAMIIQHIQAQVPLPSSINPDIPAQLEMIILKAMEKSPDNRYQSANEVINALLPIDSAYESLIYPKLPVPSNIFLAPFQAPHRLPHLSGREELIDQLQQQYLAPNGAILGLVGLGGVGKTSLAIELAYACRDTFPDGVLWAQLNTATPETELISFAAAFGRSDDIAAHPDITSKIKFMRELLARKAVLIVLDNAENSEQIQQLLVGGSNSCTFITSRNRKMLSNISATIIDLPPFTKDEAVAFLSRMVGETRVQVEIEAAYQIAKQVGGLPLALSIVAGYLNEANSLNLTEYGQLLQEENTRLENLADWEDLSRDVSASFEISYRKLPTPLQQLFAALSLFDGPDFSSGAVSAILKMPVARVKMGLGRLYSLSLVSMGLGERDTELPISMVGSDRYRLHPLLKVFAHHKLQDETYDLRHRAASYFVRLARQHRQDNFHLLDLDWQNVAGALYWAQDNQEWETFAEGVSVLTFVNLGVIGFLDARGYWLEAIKLLSRMQAYLKQVDDLLSSATILFKKGAFAFRLADFETAEQCLHDSISLIKQLPENEETVLLYIHTCQFMSWLTQMKNLDKALAWLQRGLEKIEAQYAGFARHEKGYLNIRSATISGMTGKFLEAKEKAMAGIKLLPSQPTAARISGYMTLGVASYYLGEPKEAALYYDKGVEDAKALGDSQRLAKLWQNIALEQSFQGQYHESISIYEQAIELYHQIGDVVGESDIHTNLSIDYMLLGNDEKSLENAEAALQLAQKYKLPRQEARSLVNQARLQLYQDMITTAKDDLENAIEICHMLQFDLLLAEALHIQASLTLREGRYEEALQIAQTALETAVDPVEKGKSWRVIGDILCALEDSQQATTAYQHSLDTLDQQEPYELALSQYALGKHFLKSQENEAARPLLTNALHTFKAIRTKREITATNQLLRQLA